MIYTVVPRKHLISSGIMILLVLIVIFGCGQNEQTEKSLDQKRKQSIDQLRSLGYVGGTDASEDFPEGVVLWDQENTCPGYRLYTIPMLARTVLINVAGKVIHTWQYQDGDKWVRSELLPNGNLLVIGMEQHGWQKGRPIKEEIDDACRYVMRLDWNSKLIWRKKMLAHHDIELTPDNKLLLLTFKRRLDPDIHPRLDTRDDQMTLLDQDGTVIESRSMLESIWNAPKRFPLQKIKPSSLGVIPWIDLLHSNSIEYMHHENLFAKHPIYSPDNILVCFRHQDRVAIFNWKQRTVVWSWGLNELDGPHDAQVLKNGHILIFDNGMARSWSRVLEIDPLSKKIVWEYKGNPPESFYTMSRGSAQRLSNGNTLIAESDKGRAIEITPDGTVVWEFICPYEAGQYNRAAIVRIIHHGTEFIDTLLQASP